MKSLSVVGTAAMFLVGGGILAHGIPWLHHLTERAGELAAGVAGVGGPLGTLAPMAVDAVTGVAAGALALAAMTLGRRLAGR